MYEWYLGPPHWSDLDFVGRFERLRDDLSKVLIDLGYTLNSAILNDTGPQNVSPKRLGDPIWTAPLRDQILRLEAPTIRRWYNRS